MSRIHEAIKKAEQEKGLGTPAVTGGPLPPAGVGVSVSFPPSRLPQEDAALVANTAETLTFDGLQSACGKSTWKPDPRRALFMEGGEVSLGTEEFRALRSRLDQMRDKQPLRSLLVTSALPQEGKTFVAANLAQVIMQRPGHRVLLIDADLRKSRLHQLLGAQPTPGLSDYLKGEANLLSIFQRSPWDGLFLIAAGTPTTNALELIANGRLKGLFPRLTQAFDWIILDSPPSVALTDASLLSEMCDGVLLVVQAGATPYDLAQKARRQFEARRLVGVVLNRVAPQQTYAAYYYYYASDAKAKNGRSEGSTRNTNGAKLEIK